MGVWEPLARKVQIFKAAPTFRFGAEVAISNRLLLRGGVTVTWIQNSREYSYRVDGQDFSTKTSQTGSANIGVDVIRQFHLKPFRIIFEPFIGLGVSNFYTEIPHKKFKDRSYEVVSPVATLGFAVTQRSKWSGINYGYFVEYNYAPYHWFGKVTKAFGNKSLRAGVQINLRL